MKRIVVLSLLSCALFTACSSSRESERDRNAVRNPGRFGHQGEATSEPSRSVRETRQTVVEEVEQVSTNTVSNTPSQSRPQSTPPVTAPRTGRLPYGIPVPGQPGMVKSPYAPDAGHIDVTGFAPGQPAGDPYTGKEFLVP